MPNTDNDIQEQGIPQISFTVSPSQNVQTPVDKTLSITEMAADAKATGDAIADVEAELAIMSGSITALQNLTGSDIPVNSETGAPTIAEAISNFVSTVYPVGSVFISATPAIPDFLGSIGTWTEVAVPLTWGDIRTGARNYEVPGSGFVSGNLHVWLRIA